LKSSEQINNSIRLSFGRFTTEEDLMGAAAEQIAREIRAMDPAFKL